MFGNIMVLKSVFYHAKRFTSVIPILLLLLSFSVQAQTELSVAVDNETDLSIQIYPATGKTLVILQPSEAGTQKKELQLAASLARSGIEVWLIDLLEARFLPTTQSSMDRIPATDIKKLINFAYKKTNKRIVLLTTDRGAIPYLRGVAAWQASRQYHKNILAGLILFHPKLFVETPDPGEAAELMPIVSASNQTIYIMQPRLSPWWWKRDVTLPALRKSGSDVYFQALPNVRDRFYFRPDATDTENAMAAQLPALTLNAIKLLTTLPVTTRKIHNKKQSVVKARSSKKERSLQVYKGDTTPPTLMLNNLAGKQVNLTDYKGKVVLVNFWASWCPPCVHEMPSMQRLLNRYKKQGFTILAVNMAEDKNTINTFLHTKVKVNFPILLDSDGAALQRWKVFAFPTSYVIDKQGKIRYALFGGLEWDVPHITNKIEKLLAE